MSGDHEKMKKGFPFHACLDACRDERGHDYRGTDSRYNNSLGYKVCHRDPRSKS